MRARIASAIGEPAFGVAAMISRLPWLQHQASRRLAHRLPKSQRPNLPRELSNDLGDDGWRFPKSTHFVFSVRRRVSKSPVQYQSADIIWLDTKLVLRASDWGSRAGLFNPLYFV